MNKIAYVFYNENRDKVSFKPGTSDNEILEILQMAITLEKKLTGYIFLLNQKED